MLTAIEVNRIKFNMFPICIILKIRNKVVIEAITRARLLFFKMKEKVKKTLRNKRIKNSGRTPGV